MAFCSVAVCVLRGVAGAGHWSTPELLTPYVQLFTPIDSDNGLLKVGNNSTLFGNEYNIVSIGSCGPRSAPVHLSKYR